MPSLRPYNVFISHAWDYNEEYYRVVRFLNEAPNFAWRNLSVPEHDPINSDVTEELKQQLRNQMRSANVFLIISGMYVAHSGWIDFEIAFARRIGRPIIGIAPWGSVRTPHAVEVAAVEVVGWQRDSIVSAIRRHALPEGA